MQMIILEYFTKSDFPTLVEWITEERLLYNWTGATFSYPLTTEMMEWYIDGTNDLSRSSAMVYKATDTESGSTVGHISLSKINRDNNSATISRLLVGNSTERGRGIGRAMIEAVLRIGFEELQLHRISLGVYE